MSVCAHTNINRKRNVENGKTKLLIYAHTHKRSTCAPALQLKLPKIKHQSFAKTNNNCQ